MAAKSKTETSPLMVRLDRASKASLTEAARLRGISVSDFVRLVTVTQARRELLAADQQTLILTADEQLAFWNALQEPARLTSAQRKLGAMMRGQA
jgi:uncharacterized protein (DUF1778 family)